MPFSKNPHFHQSSCVHSCQNFDILKVWGRSGLFCFEQWRWNSDACQSDKPCHRWIRTFTCIWVFVFDACQTLSYLNLNLCLCVCICVCFISVFAPVFITVFVFDACQTDNPCHRWIRTSALFYLQPLVPPCAPDIQCLFRSLPTHSASRDQILIVVP